MAVLARIVRPEDWVPSGVDELEANAMSVVRSIDNRSVIAGPGAGKTELLAQRAAYLLQTGLSPAPQRILAISFKRDAASNLGARVKERCHRKHIGRFDDVRCVRERTARSIRAGAPRPMATVVGLPNCVSKQAHLRQFPQANVQGTAEIGRKP